MATKTIVRGKSGSKAVAVEASEPSREEAYDAYMDSVARSSGVKSPLYRELLANRQYVFA